MFFTIQDGGRVVTGSYVVVIGSGIAQNMKK